MISTCDQIRSSAFVQMPELMGGHAACKYPYWSVHQSTLDASSLSTDVNHLGIADDDALEALTCWV